MSQVTYPGVYVREIPSGSRPISNVSTSVAAFIDFFKEGPVDEPMQIFGMSDFQRIFGGLDTRSEASYAISQFFMNGGSEAWVVRITRKEADGSSSIDTNAAAAKVGIGDSLTTPSSNPVIAVEAANAGAWGNTVRVSIEPDPESPTTKFGLFVNRYESGEGNASVIQSEKYLGLTLQTGPKYFYDVINGSSQLIKVTDAASGSGTSLPIPNGNYSSADIDTSAVDLTMLDNTDFSIQIGDNTATGVIKGATVNDLRKFRSVLEKAIRKATAVSGSEITTAFTGASVELIGDRYLIKAGAGRDYSPNLTMILTDGSGAVATSLNLDGQHNYQEYSLGLNGEPIDTATNFATDVYSLALKAGQKGADGSVPQADEIIGDAEDKTGLFALKDVDLFNILCLPLAAKIGEDSSRVTEMTQIYAEAIAYCEERRAICLIDVPNDIKDYATMKDWVDDHASIIRHKNSVTYFPNPRIADPENDYRLRTIGASGTMAGLYSRTDTTRGVWKAPAGTEATLRGVNELCVKVNDSQNGVLNPLGINCLRNFPVYGNISWGARTLVGADIQASEWKYVSVRRLALFLEESLFRGTKWVVFENNDEPLWASIRQNIRAFMMRLFNEGAFQGGSPDEAFFVKCDAETTTQTDRNLGVVNIEIGFAALKPAEFVVLKIQQMSNEDA
ncbi:MAG: phage tail sheath C-terminal domain-containing protein [Verrucomicrobiota bacterium]